MDEDRLKHSIAVARKMVEIGKEFRLDEKELQDLFLLGFNHDIGYEFDMAKHEETGGEILKRNNFKYWEEVFHHGHPESEYESLYLDILNMADMQVDKFGQDVGYDSRLEDIKGRYGEDSPIYEKCEMLVRSVKEKYKKYFKMDE